VRYRIESIKEEYKRESLEKNKNENDEMTQNEIKKKLYQDKSLLLEIKELYQLFNIEKLDKNNINSIKNIKNEMK
jgi:hypothetical protein